MDARSRTAWIAVVAAIVAALAVAGAASADAAERPRAQNLVDEIGELLAPGDASPLPGYHQIAPPPGSERWVAVSQEIAKRYWHRRGYDHCRRHLLGGGLIEVRWWPIKALLDSVASAPVGGCQSKSEPYINFSRKMAQRSWLARCKTVVHEFGHLVGLGHDAKYRVMQQGFLRIPECHKPAKAERRAAKLRKRARRARSAQRKELLRKRARRYARVARTNARIHPGRWNF